MSEKRKPELVFFAYIQGNGTKKRISKIELYPSILWRERKPHSNLHLNPRATMLDAYRVRVDGKWWRTPETFTLSQVFATFRRSIVKARKRLRQKRSDSDTTAEPTTERQAQ
jgi:hypothetical protein